MAYIVDRAVVCDLYQEPHRHYRILPGVGSKLVDGRWPSMRFLASARGSKSGIAGREAALFDDRSAVGEERNEFVNDLRGATECLEPALCCATPSSWRLVPARRW